MIPELRTKEEVEGLILEIDKDLAKLYEKGRTKKNPFLAEKKLRRLKKRLLGLPVVSLTLAIFPSSSLIKKLAFLAKKKFGKEAVLEIKVEEGILGGAIISFNGRYQDLSLEKKLDESIKRISNF